MDSRNQGRLIDNWWMMRVPSCCYYSNRLDALQQIDDGGSSDGMPRYNCHCGHHLGLPQVLVVPVMNDVGDFGARGGGKNHPQRTS